jgi:hypothetical protein
MKKLAIAVLSSLLLSACAMTGSNTPPTTPPPVTPSQEPCSPLVDLAAPEPTPQPWEGDLPDGSPTAAWVLATLDEKDQKYLLMLVEPEKKAVVIAFLLNDIGQRTEALQKVAEAQIRVPSLFNAVITGVRPFPQPGPPGEPGKWVFQQALSLVVAEQRIRAELQGLAEQNPSK